MAEVKSEAVIHACGHEGRHRWLAGTDPDEVAERRSRVEADACRGCRRWAEDHATELRELMTAAAWVLDPSIVPSDLDRLRAALDALTGERDGET